jgi:hypothetical protein
MFEKDIIDIMPTKKKKNQKPRKPKINLMAGAPRSKPVSFHGTMQNLEQARNYPILGCWVMEGWQEQGITPVIVARLQADNRVVFGAFMVDLYCLGVKNALWEADVSRNRFERELPRMCSEAPEACEASLAHEIIYGAIEYARRYGFEPHRDFAKASLVLDPPAAHARIHHVEFGHEGKPLFVSGPNDNARAIVNQLMRTAGEGNFDYIVGFGATDHS